MGRKAVTGGNGVRMSKSEGISDCSRKEGSVIVECSDNGISSGLPPFSKVALSLARVRIYFFGSGAGVSI